MLLGNLENNSKEKLINDSSKSSKIEKTMVNMLKNDDDNFGISTGAISKQIRQEYERIISTLEKYIADKDKGLNLDAYKNEILKGYNDFSNNVFSGRWKSYQDARLMYLSLNRKLKDLGMIKE